MRNLPKKVCVISGICSGLYALLYVSGLYSMDRFLTLAQLSVHRILQHQTRSTVNPDSRFSIKPDYSLNSVETPYIDIDIPLEDVKSVYHATKSYSNFSYTKPHFIDTKSEKLFYMRDWNNGVLDHIQTSATFYGDVYIIKDGRFDQYQYCGHKSNVTWIKQDGPVIPNNWFRVLLPLTLVDAGTFQHFQDQALLRLLQVLPIVRAYSPTILLPVPRDKILYELFARLKITPQIRFYKGGEHYGADYLIYSCILDSLHPMVWRESRRVLGVQLQLAVPIRSAYVIVLTRKGCFNCGRKLLNHDSIVDMLQKRYGHNIVKVFEGPEPLDYSLDLFGKARIIIGGHGGGFYNLNFAPENTAVVEFMPTKDDGTTDIPGEQIFFKISSILQQQYWRIAVPPKQNKDMVVDINLLEKLLNVIDNEQAKTSNVQTRLERN